MNQIIPTIAIKKASEFVARVGMELYCKWHRGPSHERAERYRVRLEELAMKRRMEKQNER